MSLYDGLSPAEVVMVAVATLERIDAAETWLAANVPPGELRTKAETALAAERASAKNAAVAVLTGMD